MFIGPQGSECVPASKYKDGVFIASPQNITKELIAKVKADVPGRSVKQHHLGSCCGMNRSRHFTYRRYSERCRSVGQATNGAPANGLSVVCRWSVSFRAN